MSPASRSFHLRTVPQPSTTAYLEQNRGPGYQVAVGFLCSLSTTVVLLRLLSRKVSNLRFWLDEAFIIVAALFSWASASTMFWGVSIGLGKHSEALDPQIRRTTIFNNALIFQIMNYCCVTLVKLSILAFYRRVLPNRNLRMTTYILIGVIAMWWIANVLTSILNCTPIKYNWDRTQPGGRCKDARAFSIGNSVPNLVIDVAILLLPLPVIWNLHLPITKNMAVTTIFSLGIFDITASAIRFQYLFVDVNDLSWTLPPVFLWTNIESDVGIICACLPAMMPLVRLIRDKCGSKKSLSPVVPKAFSLSKMAWPCGRISEQVLPTERDSLTLVGDQIDSLSSTSRASTNTVPDNEPARLLRRLEEDWPLRRVHLRPDENVVHGRV